jgi:hypothetical protein
MDGSVDVGARTSGTWWQFSLRTAFLGITDVAVLLALVVWFGKDGLLLAGVTLPLLTVPWFVQGIHVAMFSGNRRLLGTATGNVEVSKAVLGQPLALDVNPKFDFGVAKTYADTKYFAIAITIR